MILYEINTDAHQRYLSSIAFRATLGVKRWRERWIEEQKMLAIQRLVNIIVYYKESLHIIPWNPKLRWFPILLSSLPQLSHNISDWSLIMGRGGGYKMGKSRVRNFLCPPPLFQDRVKLFAPMLLNSGNFLWAPLTFNMAKTSSYRIQITPTLVVSPPSAWLTPFS